jgi:diguanylate cyclase (GGDEF)-like protein/PAS domain S-box-containing protein
MSLVPPKARAGVDGPMLDPVDPRISERFLTAARLCAAAVVGIGFVVMSGWLLHSRALESVGVTAETVKVDTALGLVVGAVSVGALMSTASRARALALACGALVALDGLAHLSEYVLGVNLGIDQVLFHDPGSIANPGRMAPNTAVALTLAGSAALLSRRRLGRMWPSNPLAIGVVAIGLVTLIGHLLDASALTGVGSATRMSVPTAAACTLLGGALLLASPVRGSMRLLVSAGPGGALARRLLPAAVVLPPVLGLLVREGRTDGMYGSQVALLLLILVTVAAVSTLVWVLARELDRKAAVRQLSIEELRKSETHFRDTFENATVGMALEDAEGRIIDANPALCEMLGYSKEELVGVLFTQITHSEDVERDLEALREMLAGGGSRYSAEKRYVHADGHEVWAILSVSLARYAEDDRLRFIVQMQDITARKRSEERFAYMAYHDELTDLPNRAMFEAHLDIALARSQRHDNALAVLCVDVDRFKIVNDSLGRAAGDSVLCEIATRLRRAVRAEDLVARQSGDEFLILLADLPRPGNRARSGWSSLSSPVSGAMRQLHQVLREPFVVCGQELTLEASVGISVFPDDAESAEELLQHASVALSDGKRAGPGLSRLYSPEDADPGGELALRSRLRAAVEKREFVLHYQPIVTLAPAFEALQADDFNLADHTVMVEALIRWEDPERGLIPPGDFIPLAEQSGLIEPIGEWVVEEVARQACRWRSLGIDVRIAFNLSPRQMRHPAVMRRLLEKIGALGADPERLVVELTESVAVESPAHTQQQFREARAWGLRSAVDDFGAGYSSLGRLLEIHPDFIKIDRSLTCGIPTNAGAMAIVEGAIGMSRGLGATPILEGIETKEQWRFAVDQGCALGQGFYLGHPKPPDELTPSLLGQTRGARVGPAPVEFSGRRSRGSLPL